MRSFISAGVLVGLGVFAMQGTASAALLESWDTGLNGWGVNQATYSLASSATGVTDGTASLAATGTASPNYAAFLGGPSTMAYTTAMANALTVSVDIFTQGGSFSFLQFDLAINNSDLGYQSVDGYSYSQSPVIGQESTLTFTIPAAYRTTLAASANPTSLVYQVGGGIAAASATIYFDNLRYAAVAQSPEPASLAMLGVGSLVTLRRRRK